MLIKRYIFPALILILTWCIVAFPAMLLSLMNGDGGFLVTSAIFALPLACLITCIPNRIALIVVESIMTLASMVEIVMVVMYKSFINAGNIMAMLTTTAQEASGFAGMATRVLWFYIPLFLLLAAVIWLSRRDKPMWKLSLCALGVSILLATGYVEYKQHKFYHGCLTYRYYIDNRILNRPPYNLFYQSHLAVQQQKIRGLIKEADNFTFGAVKQDTLQEKEIYVFAIGESLRYDNVSLNGHYFRPTTPYLEQEKNIILYDNYYSSACLTRLAVPILVTRATPETYELNFREKSIFQPFKECGFKTYVIVQEENLLSYENYLTAGTDEVFRVKHDSIIPGLVDSLSLAGDKILFVVQFITNHHPYQRYTDAFDKYHPNIKSDKGVKSDSLYINSYDNSILYQDYILHQILHSISIHADIAAMLFSSDHGQEIDANGGGHGGSCAPKKSEYHIPLILWANDNYVARYPNKWANALRHKTSAIDATNAFYTFCDLANITIAEQYAHPTWSVIADSLEWHPRMNLLPDGVSVYDME